jgi:hypothetical protein
MEGCVPFMYKGQPAVIISLGKTAVFIQFFPSVS